MGFSFDAKYVVESVARVDDEKVKRTKRVEMC